MLGRALLRLKPSHMCANMGDCVRCAVPYISAQRPAVAFAGRGSYGGSAPFTVESVRAKLAGELKNTADKGRCICILRLPFYDYCPE